MEETRVRGVIEIREQISKEIKKAQTSTREYMKTVKDLQTSLTKLEKAKGVDNAAVKKARAEFERLKSTLAQPAVMKVKADTKQAESVLSAAKSRILGALSVAAVTATATSAIKAGVTYNAQLEQSQISWATILKSEEKATAQMQSLIKMAASTPFEFAGLDSAAKKLTMAGFSGEGLMTALRNVGDAVSAIGGGQSELDGISTALYQIYTKGKLSAEEMLQLGERGISAWEILSKKMGVGTAELQKMTSDGKVMANDVLPLLIEGLGEQFGGAMEKQSKSMSGLLSTAKDLSKAFLGNATESMFAVIKNDVLAFNEAVSNGEAKRSAQEIGQVLGNAAKTASDFVKVLWESRDAIAAAAVGFAAYKGVTILEQSWNAAVKFKGALDAVILGQKALNATQAASVWGAVAIAIGAVAGAIALANAEAKKAKKPITDLQDAIKSAKEEYQTARQSFARSELEINTNFEQVREQVEDIRKMWNNDIRGDNFNTAVKSLLSQMPELRDAISEVNGQWQIQWDKIDEVLKKSEELAQFNALQGRINELAVEIKDIEEGWEWTNKVAAAEQLAQGYEAEARQYEGMSGAWYQAKRETLLEQAYDARAVIRERDRLLANKKAEQEYRRNQLGQYTQAESAASTTTSTPAYATAIQETAKPYMEEMQKYVKAQAALDNGQKGLAAAYLGMDADSKTKDIQSAIKEGQTETLREFALASLEQAQAVLTEQGDTMETLQKGMLEGYITQLTGALNGSATDISTALDWLKTLKIPIEVKITTTSTGVTVQTPSGTHYTPITPTPTPHNATGTPYFKGGETWVGERGPEKIKLPRGTQITPAEHSRQQAQARGNITVMVTGNTFAMREEADADRIADAIARKLERELLCGAT